MIGDILQPTHLLFILVIALLVLGPKRLPEVGRSLGRGLRDFRSAISGDDHDQALPPISTATDTMPPGPADMPTEAGTHAPTTDAGVHPPPSEVGVDAPAGDAATDPPTGIVGADSGGPQPPQAAPQDPTSAEHAERQSLPAEHAGQSTP